VNAWKDSVLRRFDDASESYDAAAATQRRIAGSLCRRILALSLPPAPEVLEIGCGTGFLGRVLAPRLKGGWLATDLSPRMAAACARRAGPGMTVRVMDGECPDLPGRSFDLIVSNLAVQWFLDPAAGLIRLHRLLRPGGLLAVTTLGQGTFAEWRELCHGAGVEPGTPGYPSAEGLAARLGAGSVVQGHACPLPCGDLRGFLEHLRGIGARTRAPHNPGLSPAALGRILRLHGAAPFRPTYDVLTVLWTKEC
jgi:malonyl-CoA O-methyltransferase